MKKVKSFLAVLMALIMSMSFASMAFAADVAETDAANGVASGADAFAIGDAVTGKIQFQRPHSFFGVDHQQGSGMAVVPKLRNLSVA